MPPEDSNQSGSRQNDISPDQMQGAIDRQSGDAPPSDVSSCPNTLVWVEFRLVDMEGNPIGGKRYKATLPDGSVREGSLDKSGRVRFDGIPPGMCAISYLDLDGEAWERV